MYDWAEHLEAVENLGSDKVKQYFSESEDLVYRRFDEEFERFEETDPDDLPPEDVLDIEDLGTLDYILEETKIAETAETYATVYREMLDILDRAWNNPRMYSNEMREYKNLRDNIDRNIDRYETIEDIPENIVVEVIEEELNPVLTRVQEN